MWEEGARIYGTSGVHNNFSENRYGKRLESTSSIDGRRSTRKHIGWVYCEKCHVVGQKGKNLIPSNALIVFNLNILKLN